MPLTHAEIQHRYVEKMKRLDSEEWKRKRAAAAIRDLAKNREKRSAQKQRWAKKHRARVRLAYAQWEKRNPLKVIAKSGKMRARKAKAVATTVDLRLVIKAANGRCGICQRPIRAGTPTHFDHIVPFAAGGTHALDNLQFTHARCNLRKGQTI